MAASSAMCSLGAVSAVRGTKVRRAGARSVSKAATRAQVVKVAGNMGPEMKEAIDKFIAENKVVCFIKGTKEAPRCGFSNTVVQIFKSMDVPFETVDILQDEALRQGMKVYSDWPTFPQVYLDGEFYGGCDICVGKHPPPDRADEVSSGCDVSSRFFPQPSSYSSPLFSSRTHAWYISDSRAKKVNITHSLDVARILTPVCAFVHERRWLQGWVSQGGCRCRLAGLRSAPS